LEYLEWLIDETEHALDEIAMDASGLEEAQRVIQKYTLSKPD
jgi:hypothetical protein